jgi:hypothetical protein
MRDPDDLYENSEEYRALLDRIHDLLDKEARLQRDGDSVGASTTGLDAWKCLREMMVLLQARGVDELFGITIYDLPYWATCLSDDLRTATRQDGRFLEKHLEYCESYVLMHEGVSDRELPNLGNIRNDLAELYCVRGETEKVDALYEKWLKAEPDWGFGWIGWADQFSFGLWEAALKVRDLSKAEKILIRGLAVKGVSSRDVLAQRLETVRADKMKHLCNTGAPE